MKMSGERQSLIDAVAELQKKSAEFDRKSAELERRSAQYGRKLAELERKSMRLEKIARSIQLNQDEDGASDDDGSALNSANQTSQRIGISKKTSARIGQQSENNGDTKKQNHSSRIPSSEDGKDDEVDRADAIERGILIQEVQVLSERMNKFDELVTKMSTRNKGDNRRLLLTQISNSFRRSLSSEDSKKAITLDRDTFTLMMRARLYTKPWFLGMFSFLFQVVLLTSGPLIYFSGNVLDTLVFPMTPEFLVVKCLVLIVCLITQSDILSSVHNIIIMISMDGADLSAIIDEEEEQVKQSRNYLWNTRILIPNILKITQGLLVLVVTFLVVLTSDNSVDLLKDFTALLVISQIDNVLFHIAEYGFIGRDLSKETEKAKLVYVEYETSATRCEIFTKMIVMIVLLFSLFGTFGFFVWGQQSGTYFGEKYPYCSINVKEISKIGDGRCDGGVFNTIACDFDGRDCTAFNLQYPKCKAADPYKVGNNECDEEYNTQVCGFDGNDCCPFRTERSTDPRYGDGMCDGGKFFAELCSFDNSDCNSFREKAPECDHETLSDLVPFGKEPKLGDGICDSSIYNIPECLYENGDCEECNAKVENNAFTGDGTCHGGPHNTVECNYDAGDCTSFNERWPKCEEKTTGNFPDKMKLIPIIGNGICDSGLYNNEDCGYEDGDCDACNGLVPDISKIGDGFCDGQQYMSDLCGFDGGDCFSCDAPRFEIGNEWCTLKYDTPECSSDGGDCLYILDDLPGCNVEHPSLLSNGICQNDTEYNTETCGWDGGDCLGMETARGGYCASFDDIIVKPRDITGGPDPGPSIPIGGVDSSEEFFPIGGINRGLVPVLDVFSGWRIYGNGINLNHKSAWEVGSLSFFSDKECITRVPVEDDTFISSGFYEDESNVFATEISDLGANVTEGTNGMLRRVTANSNDEYFIGFEGSARLLNTVQCISFEQRTSGMWKIQIQVLVGSTWLEAYDVECIEAKDQVVTIVFPD